MRARGQEGKHEEWEAEGGLCGRRVRAGGKEDRLRQLQRGMKGQFSKIMRKNPNGVPFNPLRIPLCP